MAIRITNYNRFAKTYIKSKYLNALEKFRGLVRLLIDLMDLSLSYVTLLIANYAICDYLFLVVVIIAYLRLLL